MANTDPSVNPNTDPGIDTGPKPYVGPTASAPVAITPGVATSTNPLPNPPIIPASSNTEVSTNSIPGPVPQSASFNVISNANLAINNAASGANIVYDVTANPAGSNTEIQFNSAGKFGAVSNLTFTTSSGLVSVGSIWSSNGTERVGNSAFTTKWANYYLTTQWPRISSGAEWLNGDNNASASFVLIDNEERVKYQSTSLGFVYEAHPLVTFKPDQFLTSVRMENKPVTRDVWANVANIDAGSSAKDKVIAFCNDTSIRNPMAINSGSPTGNATVATNPALWPSWFRLPCAEEQLEAENDQPINPSYNPAFAYVYGALPQVQGGGLQIYHPRRDSMVHITGNTIIGVNNVYHWASNAYWVANGGSGPQGNLQGDLRLQGYGNGNVIISKNDYRDGWNPNNSANTWPGKYNYSNIYNYQTGVHNGEQNNLLIEYGNIVIQPVANVANNSLGIKFADGTFQYTAANGGGGSSTIAVQEEGTNVVASANILNFVGSGVTASNVSGVATITIPGGLTGIAVQEEGTNVLATANTINFVGNAVTASNVGNVATITINNSGITVKDEGTDVVAGANAINFVGNGVVASNIGGVPTVTIVSSGISGIAVQEEGTNVLATANTINFVGSGVTASNVGNVATVTISSGGISGIAVQEEGTNVLATANTINFVGNAVTASNVGNVATITITSGGISGIDILYDSSPVTANATTLNFTGPLVNVSNVSFTSASDVTVGLTVQNEGNTLTGNYTIGTLNFVGAGVTATDTGGVATVTIPGTNVNTVYDSVGSNSTVTLNYNNGQWQNYSPNSNTVDITISNIPAGGEMTIFFQTGGTNSTIAWHGPTVFFWEGGDDQPSTTSGIYDVITIKNNSHYYFAKISKGYVV